MRYRIYRVGDKVRVEDSAIGAAIEQLKAIPYGAKHAYAIGNEGRILIEQVVRN